MSSVHPSGEGGKRDAWRRFLSNKDTSPIKSGLTSLPHFILIPSAEAGSPKLVTRRVRASTYGYQGFPSGEQVENPPAAQQAQEMWAQSLGRGDPWRRKWQSSPALLPGESPEQRNPADGSPWGRRVDTTEHSPGHMGSRGRPFCSQPPPISSTSLASFLSS